VQRKELAETVKNVLETYLTIQTGKCFPPFSR
jgi:hypothetical protein